MSAHSFSPTGSPKGALPPEGRLPRGGECAVR
jgi:hypothetical protein